MTNLIANALRYSPNKTPSQLSLDSVSPGRVLLASLSGTNAGLYPYDSLLAMYKPLLKIIEERFFLGWLAAITDVPIWSNEVQRCDSRTIAGVQLVLWIKQNRPIPVQLRPLLKCSDDQMRFDLFTQQIPHSTRNLNQVGIVAQCITSSEQQEVRLWSPELGKQTRRFLRWMAETATIGRTISRAWSLTRPRLPNRPFRTGILRGVRKWRATTVDAKLRHCPAQPSLHKGPLE